MRTRPRHKGGVRQTSKAIWASWRHREGFGKRRTDWHRHALSDKSEDASCPCGHPSQDGDHIVFTCPRLDRERRDLLGPPKTWEEMDAPAPTWRKDEGDGQWDTIETCFDFIYQNFP